METKHTKGIWRVEESANEQDFLICSTNTIMPLLCTLEEGLSYRAQNKELAKENCDHIVKCVNSHEELVNALEGFLRVINRSDAALFHYGDAIKMAESALQKAKQ